MSPYDRVVAALKANGSRRRGRNWSCPVHDDRMPSLSVDPGAHPDTGGPIVLVHCHAGCAVGDVLAAIGLEPADLFDGNGSGQMALFPASRFSPVGLDVLRMLPPSPERSFIVASALGRYVDAFGTRRAVYSQRQIAAVVFERKHRKLVVRELGITPGVLRNDVITWRRWGVAHACSDGLVTILVRRSATCPICKASLPNDASPSEPSPTDDAFVPASEITNNGFSIEVQIDRDDPGTEEAPGPDMRADDGKHVAAAIQTRLRALESLRRDEDRRKRKESSGA